MDFFDHAKCLINFGMSLGNAQFSMNVLKIIRPSVSFYEDMWCERKTL